MILDALTLLSGAPTSAGVMSGQAANGAGMILSTNTIDTASLQLGGNQATDIGRGEGLKLAISVLSAPTVGTSVTFQLIQADDADLTTNVQVIGQTDAFPIANLPVGSLVPLNVDPAAPYLPKRYVGVRYVNVGAIATAAYVAGFLRDVQSLKSITFKSGFRVA